MDERVDVGEVELRVRYGGSGPPVLLVHGHPRTGATWHRVAPRLVEAGFSVVCPDMRGYGRSGKAKVLPDHSQQSKRAVALDLVRLTQHLGHDRFAVVGHDRGCYVALRAALDAPDNVSRLVVMDGVPISEALARCDARFAHDWYHWFFFAQPDKPERAILADPDSWYGGDRDRMGEDNYQEFRDAIHDPATVLAMLEDYRAGLGVDRRHEEEDRSAGRPSAARPCSCTRPGTTWLTCTETRWRSGDHGPTTCAAPPSSRGTTWPRRTPRRTPRISPRLSSASSPALTTGRLDQRAGPPLPRPTTIAP